VTEVEQLVDLGMGIAGPALLGVFAFLWKMNAKMTAVEQRLEAHEHRIGNNSRKLHQHFEKAFTIRKNSE
jgi:hypothetical protein